MRRSHRVDRTAVLREDEVSLPGDGVIELR